MSKRKIIRAAILIAALITSITCGTAVAQAADQYRTFTTEIATAETAYQQAADSLEQTVAEIPDNELLHAELKATAESALAEEPIHYELDPNLKQVLSVFNITPEYPIWKDQQDELHAWYDNQIESLKDTSADLKADHNAWTLQQAKDALQTVLTAAQKKIDEVGSELTKPDLSTALSDKITEATAAIESATDPDALNTYASDIQTDIDELQADHDAYVKQKEKEAAEAAARKRAAEAAAAAAQAQQAQTAAASSSSGSSDNWNVSAVPSYGTAAAPADGSVGEWQSGYYIAHDWSAAGQQIASKPAHVTVNGQVYHYVSSMVVPADTTWDSVAGFVYANGGIGFQTCVGDQRLITHYEPGA